MLKGTSNRPAYYYSTSDKGYVNVQVTASAAGGIDFGWQPETASYAGDAFTPIALGSFKLV
jgi:hypothetical protein